MPKPACRCVKYCQNGAFLVVDFPSSAAWIVARLLKLAVPRDVVAAAPLRHRMVARHGHPSIRDRAMGRRSPIHFHPLTVDHARFF